MNENRTLQADCLNIGDSEFYDLPPPVKLYSNDDDVNYLCPRDPTRYYSFTCEIYGRDLIWKFNGEPVKSFLSNAPNRTGMLENTEGSNPAPNAYHISATLISIVEDTIYGVPKCNSTLVVRPVTTDHTMLIPFNITCQTYCERDITLEDSSGQRHLDHIVCQSQEYHLIGMQISCRELYIS